LFGLPRDGYGRAAAGSTDAMYDRIRAAARMDGMLSYEDVATEISSMQSSYSTIGIDLGAPDALKQLSTIGDAPLVLYVGKLIVSKGVDLLIAAWPLVRQKHPDAQLAITGFGAFREGLELLLSSLSDGDLTTARWIAAGGRAFEGGEADSLNYVTAFFDSLEGAARDEYIEAAKGMRDSLHWFGRLDHDVLSDLIPAADCQIIPSTFPEAFGMVAAEAAACGVAPISAEHSGLAEVSVQLQETLSGASGSLLSFKLQSQPIERLADRINGVVSLGGDERAELSARLAATAQKRFSWAGVAEGVLAAASGDHKGLRKP
jgi:glycosyltransferase involved in cell wall biosynthesis